MNSDDFSARIERANQKIDDLQRNISTVLHGNGDDVASNLHTDGGYDGRFNPQINGILADFWRILADIAPLLPRVRSGSARQPPLWRGDVTVTPSIAYGDKNEPAFPIIEALNVHTRTSNDLRSVLARLIVVSADQNRKFTLSTAAGAAFRQVGQPYPSNLTIAFDTHVNADVENAFEITTSQIVATLEPVVPFLRRLLDDIRDLAE